jgi:hypothetical protein
VTISPSKVVNENRQILNRIPVSYGHAFGHTRKASYQYSWDWAPYLETMGIWKKVYI